MGRRSSVAPDAKRLPSRTQAQRESCDRDERDSNLNADDGPAQAVNGGQGDAKQECESIQYDKQR